jgi:hypothetical protein
MGKWLVPILTLGAAAGVFVTAFNPVHSKFLNLVLLGCLAIAWCGGVLLSWKYKPLRVAILILPLLVMVPFLLPGREIDGDELRADYVKRMHDFEGARYYWGGENGSGIDCSGLPRRAFRDALLAYGFRNLNGRAIRSYAEQWWFDTSAEALAEGYRDFTKPLDVTGTIADMSYENLLPGDLAVTRSGVHILAYAGAGKWIQADPGLGEVATLDGRSADNGWFRSPVSIHRWQLFME